MTDLTPNDLMNEIDQINDQLNKQHLYLAREKLNRKELIEAKHELLDVAEKIYFTLKKLRTGIQQSAQSWSSLEPV